MLHSGQDKQAKRYLEYLTDMDTASTGVSAVTFFATIAGIYEDFGVEAMAAQAS